MGSLKMECILMGIVSVICYIISYKIIYNKKLNIRNKEVKNNIMLCFVMGILIHYIIKKTNLTDLYCKKICYDGECFMIC